MTVASTVPEKLDLEVYAGDENRFEIQIVASGVPVDLSGAVLSAQCRRASTDTVAAVSATFEDIDRLTGKMAMLWNGDNVRTTLEGKDSWKGVWDLQVQMPGKVRPTSTAKGKFTMWMDVTK